MSQLRQILSDAEFVSVARARSGERLFVNRVTHQVIAVPETGLSVGVLMSAGWVPANETTSTPPMSLPCFLVSETGKYAYSIEATDAGYALALVSGAGVGFTRREAQSVEALLQPSSAWTDFDWGAYSEIGTATTTDHRRFDSFAVGAGVKATLTSDAQIQVWCAKIAEQGLGVLLGGQLESIRRRFIHAPTTSWLSQVCAEHGLLDEPADELQKLIDAWVTLQCSDADVYALIAPALRAEHPAEFGGWSDERLNQLWRAAFAPVIRHAGAVQKPAAPASKNISFGNKPPAKTSLSSAEVRTILSARFGQPVIDALIDGGKVTILDDAGDLPENVKARINKSNGHDKLGFVTGLEYQGNSYLVANMMTPRMVAGVFLHEVGEHAGMAKMLGPDYGRLVKQFDRLLREHDTYATWAAKRVPSDTPGHLIPSERLAYLIERVAGDAEPLAGGEEGFKLGQESLSNLRTWLFRTPTFRWLEKAGSLDGFTLTPSDIAALARESVTHAANQVMPGVADTANHWAGLVSDDVLSSLAGMSAPDRHAAMAGLDIRRTTAYLYALAALNAPAISESIDHFRLTLSGLVGGGSGEELAVIAGEVLKIGDQLQARSEIEQQLDRVGFAMWVNGTSDPLSATLHTLAPSVDDLGWVVHSSTMGGTVTESAMQDRVDAFVLAHNSSFVVPDSQTAAADDLWARMRSTTSPTESPEFKQWFGSSSAVTAEGKPLVLYHGTGSAFAEFSSEFHRSQLNDRYQGDAFFFTESAEVASEYADASRNHLFRQDAIYREVERVFPARVAAIFKSVVENGHTVAWDLPVEECNLILAECDATGADINDLLDLARYVEGNRVDAGRENMENELFKMFSQHRDAMPEWVRDVSVALGLEAALPNQMVIPVYIRAENVLVTSDRVEAKAAQANGYDAVRYEGEGTVQGQPEWMVFSPDQIKSAISPFTKTERSMMLRADIGRREALAAWAAGTQVAHDDGPPRVVYHGTYVWERDDGRQLGDIKEFDRLASVNIVRRARGIDTVGSWFSESPGKSGADMYSDGSGAIYPVYLNIQNAWAPSSFSEMLNRMHLTEGRDPEKQNLKMLGSAEGLRAWLTDNGYDGIKVGPFGDGGEFGSQCAWVALEPTQIKSAVGNRGTFDSTFSDIRMEAALTPKSAFNQWFDGSVIVDRAGEPLVVYHGTDSDFSSFAGGVAYFSPRWDYSYIRNSEFVMPVFLSLKNPYRPVDQAEIEQLRANPGRVEELKAQGFDGVIWSKPDDLLRGASGWGNDLPQIVAFYPNQIKSAVGNRGTFDSNSDDIRLEAAINRQQAFDSWFDGSAVVDAAGQPLTLYHGTQKDFSEFKIGDVGFHFGSLAAANKRLDDIRSNHLPSSFEQVMAVFLSIKKPLRLSDAGDWNNSDAVATIVGDALVDDEELSRAYEVALAALESEVGNFDQENGLKRFASIFERMGYDGIVYDNVAEGGGDSFIAFRPEQIKSAVTNRGTFDASNPDIRFDAAPSREQAFAKWFGKSAVVAESGEPLVMYHGTNADFTEFDTSGVGAFFISSRDVALEYGNNAVAAFLSLQNPLQVDAEGNTWDSIPYSENLRAVALTASFPFEGYEDGTIDTDTLSLLARKAGFDGLLVARLDDAPGFGASTAVGTVAVAFDKKQIKSATGNRGTFDPSNPDILFDSAQSVAANFKRWFGKSKAVDSTGLPLVVYHGTSAEFSTFSNDSAVKGSMGNSLGFYFTDSAEAAGDYADEGYIVPVYLKIENPLRFDSRMVSSEEIGQMLDLDMDSVYGAPDRAEVYWYFKNGGAYDGRDSARVGDAVLAAAKAKGYDGAVFKERVGGKLVDVYLAFSAGQIKSAIGNRGTFSSQDPDIRFKQSPSVADNFANWFGDSKIVGEDGMPLVVMHASTYGDITAFDKSKQSFGKAGYGFYFSNEFGSNLFAEYGEKFQYSRSASGEEKAVKTYPVYLSIRNPLIVDHVDDLRPYLDRNQHFGVGRGFNGNLAPDAVLRLQQLGYDGIVTRETTAAKVHKTQGLRVLDRNDPRAVSFPVYVAFEPSQIKSALGNRGTFDPNEPDIRFTFAGSLAKSAIRDDLVEALRMAGQGADAAAIQAQTGWHAGLDGQWRFEIDDSQAALVDGWYSESGDSGFVNDAPAFKMTGNLGDELVQLNPIMAEKLGYTEAMSYGILTHPELFKAYPALASVHVTLSKSDGYDFAARGHFNTKTRRIHLAINESLGGSVLGSLLHEIQHSVQEMEGFARGGSSDDFDSNIGRFYDPETTLSTKEQYLRLAGEIEARNTETRADLNADQRRTTLASTTADRAAEDAIVVWAGVEMRLDGSVVGEVKRAPVSPEVARRRGAFVMREAFNEWFQGSPVTDDAGAPLVMYHGTKTPEALTSFIPGGPSGADQSGDTFGVASYFTSDPQIASLFAEGSEDAGAILPVYVTGNILSLAGELPHQHARALTDLAFKTLLPSDMARFSFGRVQQRFTDRDEAAAFYADQMEQFKLHGDGMDRARPKVDKESDEFIVDFTDFDATARITTGEQAYELFRAIGWDNVPAAGFDGVLMHRDGGEKWVVMHRPEGLVKSVFNLGTFDRANPDIRYRTSTVAQTETPAFKRWFGESVARKEMTSSKERFADMPPLVLYHATNQDFTEFQVGRPTVNSTTFGDITTERHGIFATNDVAFAEGYSAGNGQSVMPVYVSIQNPLYLDEGISGEDLTALIEASEGAIARRDFYGVNADGLWQMFDGAFGAACVAAAKSAGFDGAYMIESRPDTGESAGVWVAFAPEQVKSAIGNNGNFDGQTPDIRFNAAVPREEAFSRWFDGSQVAASDGKPLVVYHGTDADFTVFDSAMKGGNTSHPTSKLGFFATTNPNVANLFVKGKANSEEEAQSISRAGALARAMAEAAGFSSVFDMPPHTPERKAIHEAVSQEAAMTNIRYGGQVMPLYMSIRNPLRLTWEEWALAADQFSPTHEQEVELLIERAKAGGHDGLMIPANNYPEYAGETYVAFKPEQIKSAVGNNGNFDSQNPDIRFRESQTRDDAFGIWFDGSQVKAKDGSARVVYHGTASDISTFDLGLSGKNFTRSPDSGVYFTNNANDFYGKDSSASAYAMNAGAEGGANVMAVYLSIKNPLLIEEPMNEMGGVVAYADTFRSDLRRWMKNGGHDGIILTDTTSELYSYDDEHEQLFIVFDAAQIKSAIGNNGAFDSQNPDIRFSFAGAGSVTANRSSLELAKLWSEEGKGVELIRQETSWFLGVDGKWRFEIDDSNAVAKENWSLWSQDKSAVEFELGQLIEHWALFDAYPHMKAMKVLVTPEIDAPGAIFHSGPGLAPAISLFAEKVKGQRFLSDEQVSSLLHELQHTIQAYEDFAAGGSPKDIRPSSFPGEVVSRLATLRSEYDALAPSSFADKREVLDQMDGIRRESAMAVYMALAGEVEARNVQTRQAMSLSERAAASPFGTQDTASADQVIVWNGKVMERHPDATATATAEFKSWFAGSAITAEDGSPLIRYHETTAEFNEFERRPGSEFGFHFGSASQASGRTSNKGASGESRVIEAYLSIKNPLRVTDPGYFGGEDKDFVNQLRGLGIPVRDFPTHAELITAIEGKGFDGLVYENTSPGEGAGDSHVAFRPEQIKIATSLSLTPQTKMQVFSDWFGSSVAVDEAGAPAVLYHGTGTDFSSFNGAVSWASVSPELASDYAELRQEIDGLSPLVMPVYMRATTPFDADKIKSGNRLRHFFNEAISQAALAGRPVDEAHVEQLIVQVAMCAVREESGPYFSVTDLWNNPSMRFGSDGAEAIKAIFSALGFDSITYTELGHKTFGVFSPSQVKSAIGNRGSFSDDDDIRLRTAFHGSAHEFTEFKLDAIGTGEGNQGFGWGLYFTDTKAVAEFYRDTLSTERSFSYKGRSGLWRLQVEAMVAAEYGDVLLDGVMTAAGVANRLMDEMLFGGTEAATYRADSERLAVYSAIKANLSRAPGAGALYEVTIPEDDQFLLWDEPVEQQSDLVKAVFVNGYGSFGSYAGLTGGQAYQKLCYQFGGAKQASLMLNSLGVRGHRFLDVMNPQAGAGAINYVIWDESAIRINSIKPSANESLLDESAEFDRWFDGSCVVDELGCPLDVYHGSLNEGITDFNADDFFGSGFFGKGINFTSSPEDAARYASSDITVNTDLGGKASVMADTLGIDYSEAKASLLSAGDGRVYVANLAMKKPLILDAEKLVVSESVFKLAAAEADFSGDIDLFFRQFNRAVDGQKQFEVVANNRATRLFRQIASIQGMDGLIITPEASAIGRGATHYFVLDGSQVRVNESATKTAQIISSGDDIRFRLDDVCASPAFNEWIDGTYAADDLGAPILVYRGEHGVQSEAVFQSRLGALSFGSITAALEYARSPNVRTDVAAVPRVIPAYLRIANPVIAMTQGDAEPFIDLLRIAECIGYDKAKQIAIDLEGTIRETSFFEGQPSGMTVSQLLEDSPDSLFEMYVDAYLVFDSVRNVEWFKAAGFDGVIHGGNGVTHDELEYKVFSPAQVLAGKPVLVRDMELNASTASFDHMGRAVIADLSVIHQDLAFSCSADTPFSLEFVNAREASNDSQLMADQESNGRPAYTAIGMR